MTSSPVVILCRLKISRASRLARFRSTAAPNLRLAAIPNRDNEPPLAATKRVMKRAGIRTPVEYARSKSTRRRTRSADVNPSG